MEIRKDVFQTITRPTKRDVLNLLTHKSLNLNSIAENFEVSRPAISQHIKILTECGLIIIDQKGRERYCQVQPE
jgi:DNA-binding transcriptional ArsR family regulator